MDLLHGYGPALLQGLASTLTVAAASLAVACAFGLAGAVAKLSASRTARAVAATYTTLIRGLPDLVLMLLIFYGGQILLNDIGAARGWDYIDVPPFAAGVLTIGFIFGAYLTETFRGAILAVPKGQMEAAWAFGMGPLRTFWRITLPQMIRYALPGFTNNWLVLIKATALVSLIGLQDMTYRAKQASAATREPFTFLLFAAGLFLLYTWVSLRVLRRIEARYSLGTKRGQL